MSSNLDQRIGENLVTMRGEMTQKALADLMREKGHKWSQATVWAAEKGDRAIKLTEAHDLSTVLGGRLDQLLQLPREVGYQKIIQRRYNDWYDAREALEVAIRKYEDARLWLRQWIEMGREKGVGEHGEWYQEYAEESVTSIAEPIEGEALEEYSKRMEQGNGERP